jgi:hypothetical protein
MKDSRDCECRGIQTQYTFSVLPTINAKCTAAPNLSVDPNIYSSRRRWIKKKLKPENGVWWSPSHSDVFLIIEFMKFQTILTALMTYGSIAQFIIPFQTKEWEPTCKRKEREKSSEGLVVQKSETLRRSSQ